MCQYSCEGEDEHCGTRHVVHMGSRAVGGASLVMVEATAVQPGGQITPSDSGLWSDGHIESLRPVVDAIASNGSTRASQLAHAGRRASHDRPWEGGGQFSPDHQKGWQTVAPSALPFDEDSAAPKS